MSIVLRPGTAADAAACGTICYEAFKVIGEAHNFPPDFPSREVATGVLSMLLTHPRFYSVVAEDEGRIVGSNFLDERSCIAGVGPITVDPTGQNRGVGGRLMQDVLDRAARQQAAGVRLLQAGFHNRSLCLYTKLGFRTREPVSILQGKPVGQHFPGKEVPFCDGRGRDCASAAENRGHRIQVPLRSEPTGPGSSPRRCGQKGRSRSCSR
jgi:predicted N-acetyltransferase YhbS